MIYTNVIKPKGIKYKTYSFESFANTLNTEVNENLLSINSSTNMYNFSLENGALRAGVGLCEPKINYVLNNRNKTCLLKRPTDTFVIRKAWLFGSRIYSSSTTDDNFLIVYDDANNIRYCGLDEELPAILTNIYDITDLSGVPVSLELQIDNYKMLLLSFNGKLYTLDMKKPPNYTTKIPAFSSIATYAGRIFLSMAMDRGCVWYSEDINILNFKKSFEEGGYLDFADKIGGVNKLINFDDCLFAFRDFGITKIESFTNKKNFSITQVCASSSKIYDKTISVCGDKIMFLTRNGLCAFNGSSIEQIDLKLKGMFDNIDNYCAVGAYLSGCYYLACRLHFNDSDKVGCENNEYENNAVIKIDCNSGSMQIMRGVDIRDFTVMSHRLGEYLLCYYKDGNVYKDGMICMDGCVKGSVTSKCWTSCETDFGEPDKKKKISKFSLYSKENITLIIKVDNVEYKYNILGSNNAIVIHPNLIGKKISIKILSNTSNPEISDPKITVGVL